MITDNTINASSGEAETAATPGAAASCLPVEGSATAEGTPQDGPEVAPATSELFQRLQEALQQRDQLQQERDRALQDAEKYREAGLRTMADLENFRRRVTREKEDLRRTASATILAELIPLYDSLQLGLGAANAAPGAVSAPDALAQGFRMVLDQLLAVMNRNSVTLVQPEAGHAFDPAVAECLAQVPSAEVAEGLVLQRVRTGFSLEGRLLRPASVIVSSGAPATAQSAAPEAESAPSEATS